MSATSAPSTIRVALIGGTGYAGYEALRWLLRHPHAKVTALFGPENELGPIDAFHPLLTDQVVLSQELFDAGKLAELADVALLCVPHKVAMSYVPQMLAAGVRVIDWSADYRLKDAAEYTRWYDVPHTDPAGLAQAVYGLPEFFAEQIRPAKLIANPGCYPTCAALALAPLLKAGAIEPTGIVVNAISGVSGAGRTPTRKTHYPDRNENFEPYGVGTHRHMPEIEQTLRDISGQDVNLLFVPHLCPMDRGMLASIYARPVRTNLTEDDCCSILEEAYRSAPFVRVRREVLPATKYVSHTNYCDLGVRVAKGQVILFSALDNLLKGASGQAIQNMNLMFGLDETTGLY